MANTKLENTVFELELEAQIGVSSVSPVFTNLLYSLNSLNVQTPMSTYLVERQAGADTWDINAHIQDGRDYATLITFIADEPYYSQTTLPLATLPESRAFLELAELLVPILKVNGIERLKVEWK